MDIATEEEMKRGYNLPPLHERSAKAAHKRNTVYGKALVKKQKAEAAARDGRTQAVIGSQSDVDGGADSGKELRIYRGYNSNKDVEKHKRMEEEIRRRVLKGTR